MTCLLSSVAALQALEADGARRLRNGAFFSAPQLKRNPLGGLNLVEKTTRVVTKKLSGLAGIDQSQVDLFVAELQSESDRGAILVSVAILDDIVTTKLRQLLCDGSNQAIARLLDPPLGAISGFMSKVDLCFCIGLLQEPLYTDIRLLNKLRNDCAHNWRRFRITHDILSRYIEPMLVKKMLNAANDVDGVLWNDTTPPKSILIKTMAALITMVNIWEPLPRESAVSNRPTDSGSSAA